MSTSYSPALFVALALLAALSWWLYRETSSANTGVQTETENAAEAFVDQMVLSSMNTGGRLEYRLRADRADYYADDLTELENPALVIMREEGQPWHLSAERAEISASGQSIELSGSVQVNRPPEPGKNAVNARTEHLVIRPDEQIAETDAHVTLEIAESRVSADGMRAFLKQGRVELLSGVTGRYEKQDR